MMHGRERSRPASGVASRIVTAQPDNSDHHGGPPPEAAACAAADTAVQTPENTTDLSNRRPRSALIVRVVLVNIVQLGRTLVSPSGTHVRVMSGDYCEP
ncbi:hypothetical protein GCM10022254_64410 [Actinomadura meridiana]|uniref:Uncharacterized protein n=1 Tax=Actinomadura meridiana TaxID=559626 RepID=A0ABP8CLL9_9ACTN